MTSLPARLLIVSLTLFLSPGLGSETARAQEPSAPQLSLRGAIDLALRNSSRLRETGAAYDAARAAAGPLTSAYLPTASLSAYDLYSEYPTTVTPIRQQGVFPPLDDNVYEVSVNATWTVFDFGRGRAGRRAALALAEAAGIRYDLARMETIESVTGHFVRLAQLRNLLAVQSARREALLAQHDQLRVLVKEGRAAHVEVLKVAEVVLEAESNLQETAWEIGVVLSRLAVEIGEEQVFPLEALVIPEDVAEVPVATHAAGVATDGAPAVALADARLLEARHAASESRRAILPAFELFATERLRSGSNLAFDSEWMGGVRVRVPLFQGGLFAQRNVRRARVREQETALERAREELDVAVRELSAREQEALMSVQVTTARVRHLEETYRIETAAHAEGRLTLSDLLATEARLASGRGALEGARAAVLLARLRRSVLLGTLTPEHALDLTGWTK